MDMKSMKASTVLQMTRCIAPVVAMRQRPPEFNH